MAGGTTLWLKCVVLYLNFKTLKTDYRGSLDLFRSLFPNGARLNKYPYSALCYSLGCSKCLMEDKWLTPDSQSTLCSLNFGNRVTNKSLQVWRIEWKMSPTVLGIWTRCSLLGRFFRGGLGGVPWWRKYVIRGWFWDLRLCLTASLLSLLQAHGKGCEFPASCSSCYVHHLLLCPRSVMTSSYPSTTVSPNLPNAVTLMLYWPSP